LRPLSNYCENDKDGNSFWIPCFQKTLKLNVVNEREQLPFLSFLMLGCPTYKTAQGPNVWKLKKKRRVILSSEKTGKAK
jgi:uncharacterized protein (DUF2249 family)